MFQMNARSLHMIGYCSLSLNEHLVEVDLPCHWALMSVVTTTPVHKVKSFLAAMIPLVEIEAIAGLFGGFHLGAQPTHPLLHLG